MSAVRVKFNGREYSCIAKPGDLKYAERTDFIKSLLSRTLPEENPLEDVLATMFNSLGPARVKVSAETLNLAIMYRGLRDKGARLPKFSRWCTGMFRDDKTLASDLAKAGKTQDSTGELVISADIMDLLRNADTPHFGSCLKAGGMYDKVVKGLIEDCPGVALAYIDDDKGNMRGRCWVHHAVRKDTGEDVAIVCTKWGGTVEAPQVVKAIRSLGHQAYVGGSYGRQHEGVDAIAVNFVGGFTEPVHHDMYTWVKDFKVSPA